MTIDEITNYIAVGSQSLVCIFREQIERLNLFIESFYIMGKPGAYVLSVEFDPIDMVDEGEGWIWHSEPMDITELVNILERDLDKPVEKWENVTKLGHLSSCDEEIDNDLYLQQEEIFRNELKMGEALLPKGIVWNKRPE